MAPSRKAPSDSRRGSQSILARKSILIVEDEPLVALDLHATLSTVGASLISAVTAGEAIKLIGYADVSAAIVDVQLGREDATQVCNLLDQRRIPFVFYTGRAAETVVLAAWPNIPVLKKPATPQTIIAALEALLETLSNH
jgi:DNA-binding response OmpR family regulator